jgi:hypothetical protein
MTSTSNSNPAHGGLVVFSNDPLSDAPKQLYVERADGTHAQQRGTIHARTRE